MAAEVKWIKIVTNIFDDEKIKYIETLPNGDETIVIWFRILCLAGKSNSNGLLMMTDRIAYTDEMLASIFNRDTKSVQLALNIFKELGMIEMIDNKIYLTNWEKHQNTDQLEKIRESTRRRVASYRQKQIEGNAVGNVTCNVTDTLHVTPCNATELDLDLEEERDKEKDLSSTAREKNELEVFEVIEQEFKRPLSSNEIDKITYWLEKVGDAYFIHALRESVMYQKVSIAYIDRVLLNWTSKGFTLDQLNEGIQSQ
ncbi:MAG TPA: DnaD domain protein [Erysipelotrichaceae bacterium]|nr:DnaD domain protein [Erysipelotrichaceae bacterium]